MTTSRLSRQETAARAGVEPDHVDRLVESGVLVPDDSGGLTVADVRRIGIVQSMLAAGLPLEGIGEGIRSGWLSLDFVDTPEYERFAGLSTETFEQASARTGVPIELLTLIREAIGFGAARPQDLLRDDELPVLAFVELQHRVGFNPVSIERLLRAFGDGLHKMAESEAEWWRSEVLTPQLEAGVRGSDIGAPEWSTEMSARSEAALISIHHAQQAQTWTANIVGGFAKRLAAAGLHRASERQPAICFLDITGYTRLTQERGDRAAAELAETLNRTVKRTSMQHGGRPVKWLGDGVMFHFPDPGPGVLAALDMVEGLAGLGLPPAHVGLHSGPVVLQDGDYYGQTVNMASRIADYARPGEVLVSREVVQAAAATPRLAFTDIGPVELKGVSGVVGLLAARRAN
jgi:adenylate cyclase